jgi:hypothetical protein
MLAAGTYMDAIFIKYRESRISVRTVEETSPHVQGGGPGA